VVDVIPSALCPQALLKFIARPGFVQEIECQNMISMPS
jgi:hypothetical protein